MVRAARRCVRYVAGTVHDSSRSMYILPCFYAPRLPALHRLKSILTSKQLDVATGQEAPSLNAANQHAAHRLSLKRSSLAPADELIGKDASKHKDSLLEERINWWRRIDSATYNDHPDGPTEGAHCKGSYVPQYAIAQLAKHKSENQLQGAGTDEKKSEQ